MFNVIAANTPKVKKKPRKGSRKGVTTVKPLKSNHFAAVALAQKNEDEISRMPSDSYSYSSNIPPGTQLPFQAEQYNHNQSKRSKSKTKTKRRHNNQEVNHLKRKSKPKPKPKTESNYNPAEIAEHDPTQEFNFQTLAHTNFGIVHKSLVKSKQKQQQQQQQQQMRSVHQNKNKNKNKTRNRNRNTNRNGEVANERIKINMEQKAHSSYESMNDGRGLPQPSFSDCGSDDDDDDDEVSNIVPQRKSSPSHPAFIPPPPKHFHPPQSATVPNSSASESESEKNSAFVSAQAQTQVWKHQPVPPNYGQYGKFANYANNTSNVFNANANANGYNQNSLEVGADYDARLKPATNFEQMDDEYSSDEDDEDFYMEPVHYNADIHGSSVRDLNAMIMGKSPASASASASAPGAQPESGTRATKSSSNASNQTMYYYPHKHNASNNSGGGLTNIQELEHEITEDTDLFGLRQRQHQSKFTSENLPSMQAHMSEPHRSISRKPQKQKIHKNQKTSSSRQNDANANANAKSQPIEIKHKTKKSSSKSQSLLIDISVSGLHQSKSMPSKSSKSSKSNKVAPPPPNDPIPNDILKKYNTKKFKVRKFANSANSTTNSNKKPQSQTNTPPYISPIKISQEPENVNASAIAREDRIDSPPGTPSHSNQEYSAEENMDVLVIKEEAERHQSYRPSVVEPIDHADERFMVSIDRYGFPTEEITDEKEHRRLLRKENERLVKWQEMVYGNKKGQMMTLSGVDVIQAQIDQWNFVKNHRKLKSRIRKGVPQQLRSTIWQNLSGSRERWKIETARYGSRNLYTDLKNKKKSPYHEQLWKDINRTYRKHARYGLVDVGKKLDIGSSSNEKKENSKNGSGSGGGGKSKSVPHRFYKNEIQNNCGPQDLERNPTEAQQSLYNVLKAFSLYRKDIGYCQGMQSVTALLLMHMTEEEAFWVLASLADDTKYQLENLWRPSMPAIQLRFYQIERMVKLILPKLASHFEKNNISSASMYQASQWVITIFLATDMRFNVLVRVWDIYLSEGLKTVFRMGVGLLKYFEKELLQCTFEEMFEFFRKGPSLLNVEEYIKICFSFKITHAHLAAFERDFNRLNRK